MVKRHELVQNGYESELADGKEGVKSVGRNPHLGISGSEIMKNMLGHYIRINESTIVDPKVMHPISSCTKASSCNVSHMTVEVEPSHQ